MEKMQHKKFIHTCTIIVIRLLPMITSFVVILHIIFSYLEILNSSGSLFGLSLSSLMLLFLLSYTYKFCAYHQMFIMYLIILQLILLYDNTFGIPLSDRNLFRFCLFFSGIILFIILFLYLKYGDRKTD
jgi:signal transduction histidine kinase